MKQSFVCFIVLVCVVFSAFANTKTVNFNNTSNNYIPRWSEEDEALVKDRLQLMISPVKLTFNSEVKEYIQSYTTYGYKGTEKMLGNTPLYFPVFEKYLRQYNLPQQLKYLPMVESQLDPHAGSHVGAVGLWQFMPETARELGLSIGTYTDDRRDPHKSTEAAVKHLKRMYSNFQNWELAISAYNCGAGNVRKAIRLAGSKEFSKVKDYLPKETQMYLPRFVAASYIAENYHLHNLSPRYPEHNLSMTSAIKLYSSMTFRKIAGLSGVSLENIQKLNPAYLRGVIPASKKGNYLVLPEVGMTRLQSHLKYSNIKTNIADLNAVSGGGQVLRKVNYEVKSGDTLGQLAQAFSCTVNEILAWNDMINDRIYQNQQLTFYVK